MEYALLVHEANLADLQLRKACEQINLLKVALNQVKRRLDTATDDVYCDKLRYRSSVLAAVREMYTEYAQRKADVVTMLQAQVLSHHIQDVPEDAELGQDEESDEDEASDEDE